MAEQPDGKPIVEVPREIFSAILAAMREAGYRIGSLDGGGETIAVSGIFITSEPRVRRSLPPETFAELEAWLAPQIGRDCQGGENRAYVEFVPPRHLLEAAAVEPEILRAEFAVLLVDGATITAAVEAFVANVPVIFPGTERFLVRSPLEMQDHVELNPFNRSFRLRFRAARVPEWCLAIQGNVDNP